MILGQIGDLAATYVSHHFRVPECHNASRGTLQGLPGCGLQKTIREKWGWYGAFLQVLRQEHRVYLVSLRADLGHD